MDESTIKNILSACILPAAMLHALKLAGLELTAEEQIPLAQWSIMLYARLHKGEKATDITTTLSRSIRRDGDSKLIATFTDGKILELVQAAQIGGADSGNCTERD